MAPLPPSSNASQPATETSLAAAAPGLRDPLRSAAERWGRTWCDIDLAALRRNVARIARLLPAGSRIIVSAKKDAYGHGLLAVAGALRGVPAIGAFGVATVEEGLALAAVGCEMPILCFSVLEGEALAEAIRQEVTLTVTNLAEACAADDAVRALNESASLGAGGAGGAGGAADDARNARGSSAPEAPLVAHAHFKIDTGMGRMGLLPDEVADELAAIMQLKNLQLEAVYSHMADAWDNPASAREQWTRMETFRLRAGVARLPYHWGGSDALSLKESFGPRIWLRSGIALYGDHAALPDLEPVMTVKSRVVYRRAVPAGTAISYGATFKTTRRTELALIGAGYGNGYPRIVSGRGAAVLIHGRRCPILGRVCMDQIAVDVTDLVSIASTSSAAPAAPRPVNVGDEAALFGRQEGATLPAAEIARLAGTISYELFCNAGQINPRNYLGDLSDGR